MSLAGDVQLQAGADADQSFTNRPDWSPHAQPPHPVTGVIAHTPDPAKYFKQGGATVIPRAKGGVSRGFEPRRAWPVLTIDPGYQDSFKVDMSKVTKQSSAAAAAEIGTDNPQATWRMAAQQNTISQSVPVEVAVPAVRERPAGQTGYMVPQGTLGGAQIFEKESDVSILHPHSNIAAPMTPVPLDGVPQMSTPQSAPPNPPLIVPAAPVYSGPLSPQPPMLRANENLVDVALAAMLQEIKALRSEFCAPAQPAVVAEDVVNSVVAELRKEMRDFQQTVLEMLRPPDEDAKQDMYDDSSLTKPAELAVPEDTLISFLTNPPSKPGIPVMFDLGVGGIHNKRFHDVAVNNKWLALIYDTRYEGDQFIPPPTEEGQPPITITFPESNGRKRIRAFVPDDCNLRLWCLDVIQFIIEDDPDVEGSGLANSAGGELGHSAVNRLISEPQYLNKMPQES